MRKSLGATQTLLERNAVCASRAGSPPGVWRKSAIGLFRAILSSGSLFGHAYFRSTFCNSFFPFSRFLFLFRACDELRVKSTKLWRNVRRIIRTTDTVLCECIIHGCKNPRTLVRTYFVEKSKYQCILEHEDKIPNLLFTPTLAQLRRGRRDIPRTVRPANEHGNCRGESARFCRKERRNRQTSNDAMLANTARYLSRIRFYCRLRT